MILFTVLITICLISAFISCALGFFVLSKDLSSPVNRLFFAMEMGATYWALGEYFLWTAGGPEGMEFWLRASAFWPLVVAVAVHFIITFTGRHIEQEKYPLFLLGVLYIPAFVFSLLGVFTDTMYTVVFHPGVGWLYLPTLSPAYLIAGSYVIALILWATDITIVSWQQARQKKVRRQTQLLGLGLALLLIFGSLSGVFFPFFGIHIPNEIFIGNVFFSIIVVYAIQRYGLFTISPETAVPYILRTMPDGVILTDPEGKIIVANKAAAEILNVPEPDLPGQKILSLLPEPVSTKLQSELHTQKTVSDLEVTFGEGQYRVGSIAGSLVRDPSGEIAGLVLIIRNITDRKIAEMSLRVANEKISILSQMTRHDIGNLVTALSGYLELLKVKNISPECEAHVSTCTEIVEKISSHLQFSHDYQEVGSQQPSWQQLDQLIERGIKAFPREGISITIQVPPVEIFTDPLAFKVIYNLFENAVRHGGHISRFDVSGLEQPGGTLLVVFEDDGEGILDEDKQRIFEYGIGGHTGIGLSLSRDILMMTGIRISETGTAGKGARFEIVVPQTAWRASRVKTW